MPLNHRLDEYPLANPLAAEEDSLLLRLLPCPWIYSYKCNVRNLIQCKRKDTDLEEMFLPAEMGRTFNSSSTTKQRVQPPSDRMKRSLNLATTSSCASVRYLE